MDILVTSSGRPAVKKQKTLEELSKTDNVFLVVQGREKEAYQPVADHYNVPLVILPDYINTLSQTRRYLVDTRGPKIAMLDDDMIFYTRRQDDRTKFTRSTKEEVKEAFQHIESLLDEYVHVGMLLSGGANRVTDDVVYTTRMCCVLCYQTEKLRELNIHFDDLVVMEDFHVTLSLIELGYPNAVLATHSCNYGPVNADGGCSVYRTQDVQTQAAMKLKELHPEAVTVITKDTGSWEGFGERTDVRIQWKKVLGIRTKEKEVSDLSQWMVQ